MGNEGRGETISSAPRARVRNALMLVPHSSSLVVFLPRCCVSVLFVIHAVAS